jgi:hypothetical protein
MTRPELMDPEDLDLETLIGLAEILAAEKTDGHLTLMRFTTGWKGFLGTPDLDTGDGRGEVTGHPIHDTLRECLIALILDKKTG